MISFDRLTVGGSGYPLLFQSGETWKNLPLVDQQHPHDLISELGIGYTHLITKNIDISGYIGYPGEPALGPIAFMHRISSINNPDSPLGHHWQDASHITFGVATLGIRYKIFKIEGSSFTGREPGENRYSFDKPKFDSYSYRLSVNPNKNFAVQVSQGYIKSPESLAPEENVTRTTASILHTSNFNDDDYITSSLTWGFNDAGGHHQEHSFLAESNLQHKRLAIYGRFETIQKSSDELALEQFDDRVFSIQAITLGINYQLPELWKINLAIGAQSTLNTIEKDLQSIYGRNPFSSEIYLRLIPTRLRMMKTHQH